MEHLQNISLFFIFVFVLLLMAEVDDVETLNFFNFWMLIFFIAGFIYIIRFLENYKDEDKDKEKD